MSPRALIRFIAFGLVVPCQAFAHEAILHPGDFLGGLIAFFCSIQYPLGAVTMGLLAGQRGRAAVAATFVALPVGLAVGFVSAGYSWILPQAEILNIAAMVILGLVVALCIAAPGFVPPALGLFIGLSYAQAIRATADIHASPQLFLFGLVGGGLFSLVPAAALALAATSNWHRVAVRVVGSWVAAVGLMVLGLRLAVL